MPANFGFNAADWVVILVYLTGILGLGLAFGKGQSTTRDYFLGSRNIPWWGVGLSIVATETSALTFIGVPGMAFGQDHLSFIQIVIGYVLARVLLACFLVPHYFRGEIYSPYQLFRDRFGSGAQQTAGGIFLVAGTLAAGVRVYVTCIPLQLLLGFQTDEIFWVMVLFVGLSLIYTYVGGVKAVIWTDAVQFVLLLAGGIFTLIYIPTLLDGGWTAVWKQAQEGGKLQWLNTEWGWNRPLNLWMGVFGATVHAMSSHGADQLIVQRVLTCSNVKEGRKALVLSAVIIFPLMVVFLLTGVFLWVYYQVNSAMPVPIPELRPGVSRNDYVFPIFILTVIPNVWKGFLIVAILSAAMSSVSSALSALASVSTMDFLRRSDGEEEPERALARSKRATLFWAVAMVGVAWFAQQAESILHLAMTLSGLTSGAMLGGLILAVWGPPGSSRPVVAGMLASFFFMVGLTSQTAVKVAWPWFTLIGTVITLAVAAIGMMRDRPAKP